MPPIAPGIVKALVDAGARIVSVIPEERLARRGVPPAAEGRRAMRRIAALVAKDFAELRHSPGIFIPSLITGMRGDPLSVRHRGHHPGRHRRAALGFERFRNRRALLSNRSRSSGRLSPEGGDSGVHLPADAGAARRADDSHGGMSVAAHSVIGEKQARTLEPLLATPLKTSELLAAKVISAAIPACSLTTACFVRLCRC